MVPDVTAPLERFHNVLVEEIRRQRPDYLRESFPLSEIYQRLVPYRSHRDALGLDMNGDYEDVLLRLLAGAGDLVILESNEARDQIRRELDSKNPNTGLFREFATTEVHLNVRSLSAVDGDIEAAGEEAETAEGPTAVERTTIHSTTEPTPIEPTIIEPTIIEPTIIEATAGEVGTPEAAGTEVSAGKASSKESAGSTPGSIDSDVVDVTDISGNGESNGAYFDFETTALDPVELAPAVPVMKKEIASQDPTEEAAAESVDENTEGDSTKPTPIAGIWKPGHPTKETVTKMSQDDCGWCGDPLPHREDVNFCPFCGKTTQLRPCPECGDEMELKWRFCVRCGTDASVGVAAAT